MRTNIEQESEGLDSGVTLLCSTHFHFRVYYVNQSSREVACHFISLITLLYDKLLMNGSTKTLYRFSLLFALECCQPESTCMSELKMIALLWTVEKAVRRKNEKKIKIDFFIFQNIV